jgi:probable HAF family extracellular repeat protein
MFRYSRFLIGVLLVVSSQTTTLLRAAPYTYTVADLGDFVPTRMNASGQVIGYAYLQSRYAGVLYASGIHYITEGISYGINDYGQVVGSGFVGGGPGDGAHAYIYVNGSATNLNSLIDPSLGINLFAGDAINNKGQIAGLRAGNHVFVYSDGNVDDLGVFGTTNISLIDTYISEINDSGQIVGHCALDSGAKHGFIYTNGTLTDIGTLGGADSNAMDINSKGLVVGDARDAQGVYRAVAYSNGALSDISNGVHSAAWGVNSLDQIVGFFESLTGNEACIFRDGQIINLNTLINPSLGLSMTVAYDVNDSGQIIAAGKYSGDSQWHAILLTPLPEPSGILLLVIGLCGIVPLAIQQRRARHSR